MAQEFLDKNSDEYMKKRAINEVINMLKLNNINFKVENKDRITAIMIKGVVGDAELAGYSGGVENITIIQGDKKIKWESIMAGNELAVGTLGKPGYIDSVKLPKDVHVGYRSGYLEIIFYFYPDYFYPQK